MVVKPSTCHTLIFLTLVAAPATGQSRPLTIEPALTEAKGSVRLELGGDLMGAAPNPLTSRLRTIAAGPTQQLSVSPADNVSLDIQWPALLTAFQDPDFGDTSDWGDVTVRAKVRMLRARGGRPAAAFRFGVTLPQTRVTQGLGPDALRARTDLLLSGLWGASTRWHANAGLAIQDDSFRPHTQRDYLTYGLAIEQALGPRWSFVAELAGQTDGELIDSAMGEGRLGARVKVGRTVLCAAVRRGLTWASGDWGVTVGASIVVRRRVEVETARAENRGASSRGDNASPLSSKE